MKDLFEQRHLLRPGDGYKMTKGPIYMTACNSERSDEGYKMHGKSELKYFGGNNEMMTPSKVSEVEYEGGVVEISNDLMPSSFM